VTSEQPKGQSSLVRTESASDGLPPVEQGALADEDPLMRRCAAEALSRLGDPRALEPLTTALDDEDSGVQLRAQRALDAIE
jgi:HEAT repeat protein